MGPLFVIRTVCGVVCAPQATDPKLRVAGTTPTVEVVPLPVKPSGAGTAAQSDVAP